MSEARRPLSIASRPPKLPSESETGMCELAGGAFVVSIDLELFWGMRDHCSLADYGRLILSGRDVIPPLLDLFAAHNISATWAVVGFLFCADKEELLSHLPAVKPIYRNPNLSPYAYIATIGPDEKHDPYHFGQSLVHRIKAYENQELGSHTFSHFYCMELGGTADCFLADLAAAKSAAKGCGVSLQSIVFPRNQQTRTHLRVARDHGFKAFRGNQKIWFHRASEDARQSYFRRALRLADTYMPIAGHYVNSPRIVEGMVDVAASRFLRQTRGGLFDIAQLARIRIGMTRAAETDTVFHLWWHPHDFARDPVSSLAFLKRVLRHFTELQGQFGMRSFNLCSLAGSMYTRAKPNPQKAISMYAPAHQPIVC